MQVQARYALTATKRRKASTAPSPIALPNSTTPSTATVDIPGSPIPAEFETRTRQPPCTTTEVEPSSTTAEAYDDGLLPPFTWSTTTSSWIWTSPTASVPSIHIHPAPQDTPHTDAWTPLQVGWCPMTSQPRLTVPGSFTLDNPNPHPSCFSCTPSASSTFRRLCMERIGEAAEELVLRPVEVQRAWGLHASCWTRELGVCNCREWVAFDAQQEASEGEESEEEDPLVGTPAGLGMSAPLPEEECAFVPVSPGPRWADLEDEEDLPDLDEWT